jgi:hypothetical protein
MTPSVWSICLVAAALSLGPSVAARADSTGSVLAKLFHVRQGASLHGSIEGTGEDVYIVEGEAGQRLVLSFAATNPEACFSLIGPRSSRELFEGSSGQSSLDMVLSDSGPYRVRIYMEDAARRGASADYRLVVRLLGN